MYVLIVNSIYWATLAYKEKLSRRTAASLEGDDNTPSGLTGLTGRGVKRLTLCLALKAPNLFTTIHDGNFRRHSSMNVTIK